MVGTKGRSLATGFLSRDLTIAVLHTSRDYETTKDCTKCDENVNTKHDLIVSKTEKINKDIKCAVSLRDNKEQQISPTYNSKTERDGCEKIMRALDQDEIDTLPDNNMILRHFRAENGDIELAIQKIRNTLLWRQDFQVDTLRTCFDTQTPASFEAQKMLQTENATGKVYARGYDRCGRVVLYLRPGVENTKDEENQMKHLVYNIERAIACNKRRNGGRHDKFNIVIDYYNFKLRNAPPLSTTKQTIHILQNHYPERLHRAYLCNPPVVFRTLYSLASPFIDPVTKDKIVFCHGKAGKKILMENFDMNKIEPCAGGPKSLREFSSEEYLKGTIDSTFDEE